MTVALPPPGWPRELLSEGPLADRSSLLRSEVIIGTTRFAVSATRVDPLRLGPDFRQDLHPSVYQEYNLSTLIDRMSELVDADRSSSTRLAAGSYLLWMVPADHSH